MTTVGSISDRRAWNMDGENRGPNIGVLMKDGSVQKVQLKFRKCDETPVRKKRLKRLDKWDALDASLRPQASPPRSPSEQRRRIDEASASSAATLIMSFNTVTSEEGSQADIRNVRGLDETSMKRLWKRLKRRLGLKKSTEQATMWMIGEMNAAHFICMKSASDTLRMRNLFPRFTIRAPVPWHQQYLIAREYCTHNLFLTHPVMVEVRRSWDYRYSTCALFGTYWDRSHPPEVAELVQYVEGKCSELQESLVNVWIPECYAILMRLKPTWLSMVPLKIGESLQQIKRFFQSLALMLSLQIRRLLTNWMQEWMTIVLSFKGHNKLEKYSDRLFRLEPMLKLNLVPVEQQIHFNPPLDDIYRLLENCLRSIVEVSRRIPRVEQLLLPDYECDDRWLHPLSWNEESVVDIRLKMKRVVKENRFGPETYLRLEYSRYEDILQQDFCRSFQDDEEVEWNLKAKKFQERNCKLEKISSSLRLLRPFAYLKLYHLDCVQLNTHLRQCIDTIKTNLVSSMILENKKLLRKISNRFELVTEKVNNIPKTTEELVDLIDFVRKSQTEIFPELIEEVEAAGKRLLFLLDYTILSKEDIMFNCRLFRWPSDLDSVVKVSAKRLQTSRVHAEKALRERTARFLESLVEYGTAMEAIKNKETPNVTMDEMRTSSATLESLHQKLQEAKAESDEINRDERLLGWQLTLAPALPTLIEYIEPYYKLWHVAYSFHQNYDVWFHGPFCELDSQLVAQETDNMLQQIIQLGVTFANVPGPRKVADVVQKRIEKFRTFVPLLHAVCNPGLRERHWLAISQDFESPIRPAEDTTLSELVAAGLFPFLERVEEVSVTATKEFALEETLQRMQAEWNQIHFEYQPYRDSDVCVLTGVEEIQALVDDHILRSQTMHASPYVMPLEPILHSWEEQLVTIQDTMDVWLKVQNTWLYLEPIFSSEDIQRQMPSDAAKFSQVDKIWRSLMSSVTDESRVLVAAGRQGLLDDLRRTFSMLEDIQKGLHDYLERKRVFFSRFYFLSNDELLEILSKTKEPERIQPHLRKCFDGINRLVFTKQQEIRAMISAESETVNFRQNIVPAKSKGMVELWMAEVASQMKDSLVFCTHEALNEWKDQPDLKYLQTYPGQCVYCASALRWTATVTDHLTNLTAGGSSPNHWQVLEDKANGILNHLITLIESCAIPNVRMTLSNMILYYIQAKEIVQNMKAKNVSSVEDYNWQKCLRHYWDTSDPELLGNILVAMVDSQIQYGFEYLGCTNRLVITPPTDKAYRVIMLALKQYQGVWLYGDQGVGKTETIKELAWTLAKQCLIFNCFDGLDSSSIGRILKGVAQSGAWCCFDYIDRVAPDVISVSAVQVQTLLQALGSQMKRIMFEGSDIFLSSACAVFITTATNDGMPDSFKSLFRPTSVTAPDLRFVIQMSLYSSGIQDYSRIGSKLFDLIETIDQIAPEGSCQSSSHLNLRSIKEILRKAARLKMESPKDAVDEQTIIHHSCLSYFQPHFTNQQLEQLREAISGKFPSKRNLHPESPSLFQIVEDVCKDLRLESGQLVVRKIQELFDALNARNGVILLGSASVGKTTLYKILARIYPKLLQGAASEDGRVVYYAISPWSLPCKTLYGFPDPGKQGWSDGIITKALRELSANSPTSPRWMILDGYLHADLVCHLHTLLDANRKLTLPSGEILQIPHTLRIIFETCDLNYASPATVSRCHIVRVTDDVVPIEALNQSWLKRSQMNEENLEMAETFLRRIIKPSIQFVLDHPQDGAFTFAASYLFQSFTRLVSSLLVNYDMANFRDLIMLRVFTFSTIWTIGATFKYETRKNFDKFLRTLMDKLKPTRSFGPDVDVGQILPDGDPKRFSVFDYCVNVANGNWFLWRDSFESKYLRTGDIGVMDMVIANESVAMQQFFIQTYCNGCIPVLIVGNAGVGKSSVSKWVIQSLPKDRYVNNIIHVTPATTSAFLQSAIMTGLDRRRKGVYGPALGRRCVLFIDDVASCQPEHGYIRSPLELCRHWLNYESMFDCQTASKIEFVDMQLVVAARYAEPFHHEIDPRLMRHMNVIYINEPSVEELQSVFGAILETHFAAADFPPTVTRLAKVASLATIEFYCRWKPLVSGADPHYIMGVACLARVCQGLTTVPASRLNDPGKLHRLWIHEVSHVWGDRLTTPEIRTAFLEELNNLSAAHFKQGIDQYLYSEPAGAPDYRFLPKIYFSHLCNQPQEEGAKDDEVAFDEITEIDEIVVLIENELEKDHNTSTRPWMKMIISLKVATRILHIIQSLSQKRGHVILIGDAGSGRRSCALLSARLLKYEVYQIHAGRNYGLSQWKEDMKHIIRQTGIYKNRTVFLTSASSFPSEICFDHLARLIAGYEISDLFTNEERSELLDLYQRTYKENAKYSQIFRSVRENLHIALCVSPSDFTYRQLPLYPVVFKYASILWFENWPDETLETIAKKWLEDVPGFSGDKALANYVAFFKCVHNYMRSVSSSERNARYSSATYLDLITTFRQLWKKKEKELQQQKERYMAGLSKLQFAASQVTVMQDELRRLQPQLVDTSAETESLMVKIEQDTIEVEAQKEVIAADEALANEAAAAAQAIKDECESDLAEATPALEAAVTALDTLKPADITLVKSMRHPPPIVKLVMEAVCVMKQINPVKKPDLGTGKLVDDFWPAAQKILGDLRFLDVLRAYDKDNIPASVMKKIREKYIPNPEFDPNIVRHVSAACEGLCRWVRAMEVYDRVIKIVSPKRAKLKEAEQELARQMARLSDKHHQLQRITDKLQGLNDDFAAMSKKKKDLEDSIAQCRQKMERAEKLIGGLGGEQESWKSTADSLELRLKRLPGDILLSASYITYLGAADAQFRQESVRKWLELIEECLIPCSPNFKLVECLIDPVKVRSWNIAGLPNDPYSLDNGIIATSSHRWPLLIDPQDQGLKWVTEIENNNHVQVARYDDANYLQTLTKSIVNGNTLIITNVEGVLDPELQNVLEKRTARINDQDTITVGSETVVCSSKFRLYLITRDRSVISNLEITSKFTVVDFTLTRPGLEDRLLGLFLSTERPELEERKQSLVVQSASNQKQLRDLEDRILRVLSNSRGNILEDETATRTLYSSKMHSEEIYGKQQGIQKAEREIDTMRNSYRPIAVHAASLYACIGKMKKLNHIYQFSLTWFINLFNKSSQESTKASLASERVAFVNDHFTQVLHQSVNRSLFQKDRLLFTILFAVASLHSRDEVDLQIARMLFQPLEAPKSQLLGPSWIDANHWRSTIDLSHQLAAFQDLPEHIENHARIWKKFYTSDDYQIPLPTPWNEKPFLEKMLIIKHLKPDRLMAAFQDLIKTVLGPNFLEFGLNDDLSGVYDESLPSVPIICFVDGNSNPVSNIMNLCDQKLETKNRVKVLPLGRGVDATVLPFVQKCASDGTWAILQNCHLFPQILETILDHLSFHQKKVHADFRLWLVGSASPDYPPRLLQNCVKTVSEPPNCYRDGLLQILGLDFVVNRPTSRLASADPNANKDQADRLSKEAKLKLNQEWSKISLVICSFHALLLERQRYRPMGTTEQPIEFTFNDLKSAMGVARDILVSSRSLAFESMRSLISQCVYEAQLTRQEDINVIQRFINFLLKVNILHDEGLLISLCHKFQLPLGGSRRIFAECVRNLPTDLGPAAVGLSKEFVKQLHVQESTDVLKKLAICYGDFSEPL